MATDPSMADTIKIAIAQLNFTLGDLEENARKISSSYETATRQGADLVITSELSISGYSPEDLVLRQSYVATCMAKAETLAKLTAGGPALIIGLPWVIEQSSDKKPFNAAALLKDGKIEQLWFKHDLPNYGVFDDKRVFSTASADAGEPFLLKGARIGIAICEDMWSREKSLSLKRRGANFIVSINASPYETDKVAIRRVVMTARVKETGLPIIYANQLGGQDEVIFDGGSFVMNTEGAITSYFGQFEEKVDCVIFEKNNGQWQPRLGDIAGSLSDDESIYSALIMGLRDYVLKNKFPGVILGMSGGIDSAFVSALAVDALGKDKVINVMMPSPYTSKESIEDAQKASALLGCDYRTIPISEGMNILGGYLKAHTDGYNTDIADQNIQSRLRGLILMALSNTFGHMVVATGNKSEMATGYATLYGDMCGGFAAIKDVYKTLIYRLSRWRNLNKPKIALGSAGFVIPERIITRAPTAELKNNQTDQDTLPPYPQLDDILQCLIEWEMAIPDIVSRGHDAATVTKIFRMLKSSEYKRFQAPPGTKITSRCFGRDRRYPLTSRFFE